MLTSCKTEVVRFLEPLSSRLPRELTRVVFSQKNRVLLMVCKHYVLFRLGTELICITNAVHLLFKKYFKQCKGELARFQA